MGLWSLGNAKYCGANLTDFWTYENTYITNNNAQQKVPFWWMKIMTDPDYVKQLKLRWKQYREGFYSNAHIEHTIDSLVSHLDINDARKRNYDAWPLWNTSVWPVPNWDTVNTWEKEISYLKTWLKNRIGWIDQQLEYNDSQSGIDVPLTDKFDKQITGYYNIQGIRIQKPQNGIVIIKYKDGSSRKIKL